MCLAEDLEQVVVSDEVEAREALPLVLEEVGERLLAALELVEDRGELLAQPRHLVTVGVGVRVRVRLAAARPAVAPGVA